MRKLNKAYASMMIVAMTVTSGLAATLSNAHSTLAKSDDFVSQNMADKHAYQHVIVKFDGQLTRGQRKQLGALGVDVYRNLSIVNSVAASVRNDRLVKLSSLPFVTRISSDAQVKKNDYFTCGDTFADVAYSQYGLTGNGVGIAVIDSGVKTAPDLGSRIKAQVNFGVSGVLDDCGHGSFVAGLAAGDGTASTGPGFNKTFFGIARKANVLSVRVLNAQGQGTVSDVVAGLQWCVNNAAAYNIRVVNLSLGHPVGESYTTDPLCQAAEATWKSGLVVVCAAGNNGRLHNDQQAGADNSGYGTAYGTIESPGNDPYVITVGAMKSIDGTRNNDTAASYSSRGPSRLDFVLKPDIVAPGNQVISIERPGTFVTSMYAATNEVQLSYYGLPGTRVSDRYCRMSGTSMAAPVVAGAAALLLENSPTLSPDTIKARLMVSADKWLDPDGNANPLTYGAGFLNVTAALQCGVVATQYATSPWLSEDANGNVYINVGGSGTITSGNRAIWGTNIDDFRAIWGNRAIWGTNTLEDSRAIWGTGFWYDNATSTITADGIDLSSSSFTIRGE